MGGPVAFMLFVRCLVRARWRRAPGRAENAKGNQILAAIRDFGLVPTPQFIEWTEMRRKLFEL
jgi:hypothetical protein